MALKGQTKPIIPLKQGLLSIIAILSPNFDTRMSITKFAFMTDEIQNLINASSMHHGEKSAYLP
ncbi:hypothetical protein DX05_09770 [Streptococcus agalactiae]|nr:hypothetical protein DX05_09770 [Streptococcus agalactiae]